VFPKGALRPQSRLLPTDRDKYRKHQHCHPGIKDCAHEIDIFWNFDIRLLVDLVFDGDIQGPGSPNDIELCGNKEVEANLKNK
jgi:hypothetical protein